MQITYPVSAVTPVKQEVSPRLSLEEIISNIRYFFGDASGTVRVRIGNIKGGSTSLVELADLPALLKEHELEKNSISYGFHDCGQSSEHVTKVYWVAIDLDKKPDFASRAQLELLRARFPGAVFIYSNGITLLYRLEGGMTWEESLKYAYQIAREAERVTGLSYDIGTHFTKDMQPARHAGHLFRAPAGFANRRNAPVEVHKPLIEGRNIVADAEGLNYELKVEKVEKPHRNEKAATFPKKKGVGAGSESEKHELCSARLSVRAQVLRKGGTVEQAAAKAAAEFGGSVEEVMKLYRRPGYEPKASASKKEGVSFFKDSTPVDQRGLQSSSRRFQWGFAWWHDFAHSLQGFWDVQRDANVAYLAALSFPEFQYFRTKFRGEFGSDWAAAMRQDVDRCFAKYYDKAALKKVSKRCIWEVQYALTVIQNGSAVAIGAASLSSYSDRQVKRALVELSKKGFVSASGEKRWKKWELTEAGRAAFFLVSPIGTYRWESGIDKVNLEAARVGYALKRFSSSRKVGGISIMTSKRWKTPVSCPTNDIQTMKKLTNEEKTERLAQRKAASAQRKAAAQEQKDRETCLEINNKVSDPILRKYYFEDPAGYRLIKSVYGRAWDLYFKSARAGKVIERPREFSWYLIDSCGERKNSILWRKRRAIARRQREKEEAKRAAATAAALGQPLPAKPTRTRSAKPKVTQPVSLNAYFASLPPRVPSATELALRQIPVIEIKANPDYKEPVRVNRVLEALKAQAAMPISAPAAETESKSQASCPQLADGVTVSHAS